MQHNKNSHCALLLVDIQNDFCPNGALAVPEGDAIVPLINEWIDWANNNSMPIIASRDWHPENHCSFQEQGGIWPAHCIQNSSGALFHPKLNLPPTTVVVNKAAAADSEAYSALLGNLDNNNTPFTDWIKKNEIEKLWICGLALEYCVKYSVLDAIKHGLKTSVIIPACRAITETGACKACQEMQSVGAMLYKNTTPPIDGSTSEP